jgi:hypothetical protein
VRATKGAVSSRRLSGLFSVPDRGGVTRLVKAAEAWARQLNIHCAALVRFVWECSGKLGPVAGLKANLLSCGVEVAGNAVLRRPLEAGADVRKAFLLQAAQLAADLRKAAARQGPGRRPLVRSRACSGAAFCGMRVRWRWRVSLVASRHSGGGQSRALARCRPRLQWWRPSKPHPVCPLLLQRVGPVRGRAHLFSVPTGVTWWRGKLSAVLAFGSLPAVGSRASATRKAVASSLCAVCPLFCEMVCGEGVSRLPARQALPGAWSSFKRCGDAKPYSAIAR